jgi:hypothetical protein
VLWGIGRIGAVDISDPDEVQRLRTLVGPSEQSYEALRRDRDESMLVARDAQAELGKLRGENLDLRVQVLRARQDQEDSLVGASLSPIGRARYRARRRWITSVAPRAAMLDRRIRRALAR